MDPGSRNSGDGTRTGTKNILKMEDELVKRLVEFIESGHGDSTFGAVFRETMYECCLNDNSGLQQLGIPMIEMLTRLIDLLLEYRSVIIESEIGNTMSCIVNLLDFSMEIGRKELYLRYLYKLHELHVKSGNFTEAAFAIRLHSRQLDWSEDECPSHLRSPLQPLLLCQSQWEMKEALYYEIINYFDKAKMWECALEICDELRSQYADETYNYALLSPLLQRMSSFYNSILKGVRCDPEYFRVAFFGTEFPAFLQDKAFVYRGKEYEKLSEFEARMLERFPKAELLRSLNRPSEEIRTSGKQCKNS
jgi:dedicator of cytokinesis protein 1